MHLVLQSEPVQLTAGGRPDVSREPHVIAAKALTCTVRCESHTSLPGNTACSPEATIPRLADPVGRHTQIRPTSPGSLGWHAVPAEGPGRHLPTRPETPGANTVGCQPLRTERRRARSGVLWRAPVFHVRAPPRLAARILRQSRRRTGPYRFYLGGRPPSWPPCPAATVRDGRTAVVRLCGLRAVDLAGAHTKARCR